jgi:hypothetical protein
LLIGFILFERLLIDHTGMSQLLEGFSVDSSSIKQDKSRLGMTIGSLIDLILFERTLGDLTDMSQILEGFSVDSSSSKQDKSSLGMTMTIGSLTTTAELHVYDIPFSVSW